METAHTHLPLFAPNTERLSGLLGDFFSVFFFLFFFSPRQVHPLHPQALSDVEAVMREQPPARGCGDLPSSGSHGRGLVGRRQAALPGLHRGEMGGKHPPEILLGLSGSRVQAGQGSDPISHDFP